MNSIDIINFKFNQNYIDLDFLEIGNMFDLAFVDNVIISDRSTRELIKNYDDYSGIIFYLYTFFTCYIV